jgi:2'-5' RNA ligase
MSAPAYIAVFLDEEEILSLRMWFFRETKLKLLPEEPKDPHLTLVFKPTPLELESAPIGREIRLNVTGWAADDRAQVLTAKGYAVTRDNPHVTLALATGVAPAYSNELLERGPIHETRGPSVKGFVGYFDEGLLRFKYRRS